MKRGSIKYDHEEPVRQKGRHLQIGEFTREHLLGYHVISQVIHPRAFILYRTNSYGLVLEAKKFCRGERIYIYIYMYMYMNI